MVTLYGRWWTGIPSPGASFAGLWLVYLIFVAGDLRIRVCDLMNSFCSLFLACTCHLGLYCCSFKLCIWLMFGETLSEIGMWCLC